jgi:hypothetical protein
LKDQKKETQVVGNMISDKVIEEAYLKAEEFSNKLPFEFFWDYAGIDKQQLKDTVIQCFVAGYIEAKKNELVGKKKISYETSKMSEL